MYGVLIPTRARIYVCIIHHFPPALNLGFMAYLRILELREFGKSGIDLRDGICEKHFHTTRQLKCRTADADVSTLTRFAV